MEPLRALIGAGDIRVSEHGYDRLACGHMSTSTTGISRFLAISVASTKDRNVLPTPPLLFQTAYRICRAPFLVF
jgi:hypothetical protein